MKTLNDQFLNFKDSIFVNLDVAGNKLENYFIWMSQVPHQLSYSYHLKLAEKPYPYIGGEVYLDNISQNRSWIEENRGKNPEKAEGGEN